MKPAGARVRTAGSALVGALVVTLVVTVMALANWLQVSTSQRSLARIQGRRLAEVCAVSAVEETCAVLEDTFATIPAPKAERDLGATLAWPAAVDPVETRSKLTGERISIGTVTVRSSPWRAEKKELSSKRLLVREMGILEFVVRIEIASGSTTLAKRVCVRRYAAAVPAKDFSSVGLRVQGNNLMLAVTDA